MPRSPHGGLCGLSVPAGPPPEGASARKVCVWLYSSGQPGLWHWSLVKAPPAPVLSQKHPPKTQCPELHPSVSRLSCTGTTQLM